MSAQLIQQPAAPRLDYIQQAPRLFDAFLAFSQSNRLDKKLTQLVDIRASQLNRCAFCLDMHIKQASLLGEPELRLHHVSIWRESALFSPRERAALAWTEVLTDMHAAQAGVSDVLYDAVREQLGDEDLLSLSYRIVAINGWNRLNVAFLMPPGSQDHAFGLSHAPLR